MFEVGELIKRHAISPKARALCIVVENTGDNYTLYNNSKKTLQTVACVVVNNLYTKHT
jgi:hypothetical protein